MIISLVSVQLIETLFSVSFLTFLSWVQKTERGKESESGALPVFCKSKVYWETIGVLERNRGQMGEGKGRQRNEEPSRMTERKKSYIGGFPVWEEWKNHLVPRLLRKLSPTPTICQIDEWTSFRRDAWIAKPVFPNRAKILLILGWHKRRNRFWISREHPKIAPGCISNPSTACQL